MSEADMLSEQGCACTCCSGRWETVSITLRCSGGCGCVAGTDLGKDTHSVALDLVTTPIDAAARLDRLMVRE